MSYDGISIREAMERINRITNGWFLPQVQRQYVWGQRSESEGYICLLLDSIFKGYPIGGIVVWETEQSVPFREFMRDYYEGTHPIIVDETRWGCPKSLIYDGQQRLQTLYSVLFHRFNNQILGFDLLFNPNLKGVELDDTGFSFFKDKKSIPPTVILLPELGSFSPGNHTQKAKLEERILQGTTFTVEEKILIKSNISCLWDVFVEKNKRSIAFYKVESANESEVIEIFRRLNIGGISLTQSELVLSEIKAKHYNFEEKLWAASELIRQKTFGYHFSSAEILQFLFLQIFGSTKIDSKRITATHVDDFSNKLDQATQVMCEFFEHYLWGQFHVNHCSIVPRGQALLPLMSYLLSLKTKGHPYEIKRLTSENLRKINKYFLLSQFCDWNTQTMIGKFTEAAKASGDAGQDFPFEKISAIAELKNRPVNVFYHHFVGLPLFALKILTPNRSYLFFDASPQIDHIFPKALSDALGYKDKADVLWNYQPLPPGINNYKRAKHPLEFFKSSEGAKFFQDYDFLPKLESHIWSDYKRFIWFRHRRMRKDFKARYDLSIQRIKAKKEN